VLVTIADEPIHEGVEFLGMLGNIKGAERDDQNDQHVAKVADHPPGVRRKAQFQGLVACQSRWSVLTVKGGPFWVGGGILQRTKSRWESPKRAGNLQNCPAAL
jgi:hypothetical protein